MYPHRIRLRGPWECARLGDSKSAPMSVTMPCHWSDAGLAGYVGAVRFTRKFGYPGRIDDTERVWLTCSGLTGRADVSLNGTRLGDNVTGPFAYPVTSLLGPRNRLEIVLQGQDDSAGLWGEVALEVRALAYLTEVHPRTTGEIGHVVVGQVVGEGDATLELYILADGKNVHYQPIRVGDRFEVAVPAEAKSLRLELVHVAVVWDVVAIDSAPLATAGRSVQ